MNTRAASLGFAMELFGHVMLEDDLVVEPLDYAGGRVRVPDGPGLGVTLDRDALRAAQTPQVVRIDWLREGLAKALADGFIATDEAQLVERLGLVVHIVEGDPSNRKITHADDLAFAEAELRRRGETC